MICIPIDKQMSNVTIELMSISEINSYLNSGRYISASIRKMLEDKLAHDKIFNLSQNQSNNFFSKIAVNTPTPGVKQNNKLNDRTNFPEFSQPTKQTNIPVQQKTIWDTNKLLAEKKSTAKNKHLKIKSLYVNNQLVIDFDDIMLTYDFYAIYRIKMNYFQLRRKINVLNQIEKINPKKAKIFKLNLSYDKLLREASKMKICLEIYSKFQSITNCLNIMF
jgi:hypothetical protein